MWIGLLQRIPHAAPWQGYGISMRNGLTYKELSNTVGIHPTSSEEIVTLSITKSSGEDAAQVSTYCSVSAVLFCDPRLSPSLLTFSGRLLRLALSNTVVLLRASLYL
jgi:hypothetical protein